MLNLIALLLSLFTESVDVKDRERCDDTAEAGLSAATTQERHTVAGVITDLDCQQKPSEMTAEMLSTCTSLPVDVCVRSRINL